MQTLANLLSATNAGSACGRKIDTPARSSDLPREPFDALMSRALSPTAQKKSGSTAWEGRADDAAAVEKRDHSSPRTPHQPGAASGRTMKTGSRLEPQADHPALAKETDTRTAEELRTSADGDDSNDSPDLAAPDGGGPPTDHSENLLIQLPALVLLPCPLTALSRPPGGSVLPPVAAVGNQSGEASAIAGPPEKIIVPAPDGLAGAETAVAPAAGKTVAEPKMAGPENLATSLKPLTAPPASPAEPQVAAAPSAPPPASELASPPGSSREMAANPTLQLDGTAAAKQEVPMKNEANTNKVAGLGEKVLPGGDIPVAPEKNLPGRANGLGSYSSKTAVEPVATANSPMPAQAMGGAVATVDSLAGLPGLELPVRTVERLHDMVALHSLRVADAKLDSLSVVIKPGAGLQLTLELRQRGDSIEVLATMQHGDFDQMNQHWSDLQQRLEQRGVRLAPLAEDAGSAAFGGSGEQQQREPRTSGEPDLLAASAFAEFALASAMTAPSSPPAVYASAPHGWQSWA